MANHFTLTFLSLVLTTTTKIPLRNIQLTGETKIGKLCFLIHNTKYTVKYL